jgi:4-carboxymuconolactone decarboxylase
MQEKRKIGIKNINKLVPNGEVSVINGLGSIAPDMAGYVLDFIFGDLYAREGIDIKTKQTITITTLAVLGNAKPQLAYHIKAALNLGFQRKEVVDILTHISGYAGFPAALNGIAVAKEVFKELDKEIDEVSQ